MNFRNNAVSGAVCYTLLSVLLLAAEGRTAVAEEKPGKPSSADILVGPEIKDGTPLVESGAQMEPVLVVANLTEASNNVTTTEPIKVLAKAELINEGETQKSPLVSVVPPANATEPMTLVAKVPAGKPLEIHANVPLNTPVKVITEVAPEIPDVAIVVHRGMRVFTPWRKASSTTRGMFNVNFK